MKSFDVIVVGAGPAGMSAAAAAAKHGCSVCLIDDNVQPGGQIWRGSSASLDTPYGKSLLELQQRLRSDRVELRSETGVIGHPNTGVLRVENACGVADLRFRRAIVATGARERFLPFPGWTLPGVMGAGGLQAIVEAGMPIAGKRVVLAGSGPLLLAVAAALARKGARIIGVYEQAALGRMIRFGTTLLRYPSKLRDGIAYRFAIRATPYRTSSWIVAAHGDTQLASVTAYINGSTRSFDCDLLGCGFHLVPNLELPRMLGCRIEAGYVHVNELQQTSVENVYCAGEPTGIGGVEKAVCEGEIAGLAAAECPTKHLVAKRDRYSRFARRLDRAFALRPELKRLAEPGTFVCRCEDVPYAALESKQDWREAKLHTRCGMGPCQGRICGPASEYLFGWNASHVRPPIFPARVSSIAATADQPEN